MTYSQKFGELSVFDRSGTVALYLTIAVIVFGIIIGLVLKKVKPESLPIFKNVTIGLVIGYAIGLLGVLCFLKLDDYIVSDAIVSRVFYPIVAFLCSAIVLAIAALLISLFKRERFKLFSIIAFSILGAFAIVIFILSMVENYQGEAYQVSSEAGLYIFTIAIVAIIVLSAALFGKKTSAESRTKSIVYAAVCITVSFALSYIRFFELPLGGSITFASLVPLMLYSYMFGIRKGVLAGIIYGVLQFIQAPWFVHPIQFLLDYPIAFMAIGLTGVLKESGLIKKVPAIQFGVGATIAVIIRYFSHVVSGIFIWGSGDPTNYGAVAWSFLYNSFSFIDLSIALVAGCLLFASKSFVKQLNSVTIIRAKRRLNNGESEALKETVVQNSPTTYASSDAPSSVIDSRVTASEIPVDVSDTGISANSKDNKTSL